MIPEQARWFADTTTAMVSNIETVILGKTYAIRLALTCMLAEGHLLLEDYPGTGKTSLARAMAQTVQGSSSRIQFTPDLLPSDVTGVTIYDQRSGEFEFHQGPIFASIVLADEINRASPKTQSALLEVMEESKVTVDGKSYGVGTPFMVIATQNPIEQAGTLPVAGGPARPVLDEDLTRLPRSRAHPADPRRPGAPPQRTQPRSRRHQAIAEMAELSGGVHIDVSVLHYITRLVEATRTTADIRLVVSIRGGLALVRCTRVWADAQGRHYVVPDDVKELARPCLAHRLILDPESEFNGVTADDVMDRVLLTVNPPTERASA